MSDDLDEFYNDFRQEILAGAAANSDYSLSEFLAIFQRELSEAGQIEDFTFCFYENAKGVRIDGFWMNDDAGIDLFIADFKGRTSVELLSSKEVETLLKRVSKFYLECVDKKYYEQLEEMSAVYGLARQIFEQGKTFGRINVYLLSERRLTDSFKKVEVSEIIGETPLTFHIWDITRLHRLRTSKGAKEPIRIDLKEVWGNGIPCLPAHLSAQTYRSYLLVMPGNLVADLYARYSARLLEQNVRSFLQARASVNKGIRETIMQNPEMFFAYNNGITATATEVTIERTAEGEVVTEINDLQIVNGGQTTASLFHTRRKDKANLDNVFVQMKLSIVEPELSETIVPKISEYANTQNRVNAADFFANHPFHIQMEKFSRRLWAPAAPGAQRETKWFYERARGQFSDAQAKLTTGEKKRFLAEYPKEQMFTKTDLAKFDNVWDEHPKFVNLGSQKNFAQYARRISGEWKADFSRFSEHYYRQAIARGIIFRATEKIVSEAPWYNGGYRANIVAYTLALLGHIATTRKQSINFEAVWQKQRISHYMREAISTLARFVNMSITFPPEGISNISEWAKREGCWTKLIASADQGAQMLNGDFFAELTDIELVKENAREGKKSQKMDAGIEAQTQVVELGAEFWKGIAAKPDAAKVLSLKEIELLGLAAQIPRKVPTERQAEQLLLILEKFPPP
ncbi:AIPR family protein [Asticcacaulis biprosthecium C19]|uniref:AIPR family protein n=1 Tax=Asticcacaulis biprosthecium C19 TaxID=715226 RepID=F4QRW2_9CAUL|nr:AIPR family protein [Asticcacaulis biprosthecium]EGF89482.1 AIPR family protein [Asticcacaulis biprosthecium C19]